MADSVVSFLLENVSQLLTNELNLLGGAEEQVRSLESWLKLTKEFLKKTSRNREHDSLRELVEQIRDAAQEAEDAIDSYVVHRLKQQRRSKLGKLFHHVDHGAELHRVASNVKNIKNRIQEIYDNKDTYGIDLNGSVNPESVALLHRRRKDVEEEDVVGFIREAETLKTKLIGQEWTAALDVISIIGMGGLGKTTLARKIYNDVYIKDHFNCRAWVYVSNDFRIRDLLLRILRCLMPITEEISSLEDADLKKKLCKFLTGRRYLVVLDDVWQTDLWDDIKNSFPDNNNGSKILVREFSCTRSFLSFDQDNPRLSLGNGKYLCKGLKLIKVLDLGVVVIEGVPDKIGRLVYLRYLKLNSPSLRTIPRVICNLPNLQTLNLKGSRFNSIPNDIWKLKQLRHIYLSGPVSVPSSSKSITLENLQTLSTVANDDDFIRAIQKWILSEITNIRIGQLQ